MFATVVVAGILGVFFFMAAKKTAKDIKNNQCSGCSGCSSDKKSTCDKNYK